MSDALYHEAVPVFSRFLENLKQILVKARQHAAEHKFEESALLTARLFPDMFACARQVQIACDSAKGAVARLSGNEIPRHPDVETTIDELLARIDKTLAFIRSVDARSFEGADSRNVVLQFGDWRREFASGSEFLRTWALPNFYFHVTTAYGILRHNGVPVGKMDYLA